MHNSDVLLPHKLERHHVVHLGLLPVLIYTTV